MTFRTHSSKDGKIALWLFWAIISLIYCLTVTLTEFSDVPVTDRFSLITTAKQYLTICFFTAGLFAFVAFYKWIFATVFPIVTVVSAVMVYFHLTVGIRLTPVAIEVALINDASMWWTMVSGGLITVLLSAIIYSAGCIYVRFKYVRSSKKWSVPMCAVGFAIVLMPTYFIQRLKLPVGSRLPYAIYQALNDYLENRSNVADKRTTFDSVAIAVPEFRPDVYLVIGESLRSDHLPTNGYERNTMPLMSADTSFVTYPDTYCEFTYTDISLPQMLTRAEQGNEDAAYSEQSFITLFKRAGYRTAWFANQDISRSYAYFAHETDSLIFCNANGSLYSFDKKWLDADMLPFIDEWRQRNGSDPRFAVVHTIGSHWWYPSHFTEEQIVFKPIITHKDIGGLGREEIINSYDNTIIATDRFLYDFTNKIKDDCAIVLYVSDHGEGLGENGKFLHASESEVLHKPAVMWWYTNEYAKRFPEVVAKIKASAADRHDTSSTFKTILDVAGIETPAADNLKSMLKQ